jgi:hypothetical protein
LAEAARSELTAIGFRVKSGWATTVLLTGPIQSPTVLDRRAIDLCDPASPESRQPYHAAMGKLETDQAKIERRRKTVVTAANRSITELMKDYGKVGHRLHAAGLVVGSEIDPARITNPHIRAHAFEGRLFRTVLEDALHSWDLRSLVLVERHAYKRASEILGRSENELKHMLSQLGRSLGGPWRADEKTATLAAWLALGDSRR